MHKSLIALATAAVLIALGGMVYVMFDQQSQIAPEPVIYEKGNSQTELVVTAIPADNGTENQGDLGTTVMDMNVELEGTVDDGGAREVEQVMKDSEQL